MSGFAGSGFMAAFGHGASLGLPACHGLDIPFTGEKIPKAGQ